MFSPGSSLSLPLTSWKTLDKWLTLSEPLSSHV